MGFGATTLGGALGLGAGPVATALASALARSAGRSRTGDAASVHGARVIVIGDDLGRAVARTGLSVIAVSPSPKRRKKGPPQVAARPEAMPFADECADAVFAAGVPPGGAEGLRALGRLVRDGGLVGVATTGSVLVRRVSPPEVLAAAFVHAALVDVEQHQVGSMLLSLGRVRYFGRASVAVHSEIAASHNSPDSSDGPALDDDAAMHKEDAAPQKVEARGG